MNLKSALLVRLLGMGGLDPAAERLQDVRSDGRDRSVPIKGQDEVHGRWRLPEASPSKCQDLVLENSLVAQVADPTLDEVLP
jgi:hypothetical protein